MVYLKFELDRVLHTGARAPASLDYSNSFPNTAKRIQNCLLCNLHQNDTKYEWFRMKKSHPDNGCKFSKKSARSTTHLPLKFSHWNETTNELFFVEKSHPWAKNNTNNHYSYFLDTYCAISLVAGTANRPYWLVYNQAPSIWTKYLSLKASSHPAVRKIY